MQALALFRAAIGSLAIAILPQSEADRLHVKLGGRVVPLRCQRVVARHNSFRRNGTRKMRVHVSTRVFWSRFAPPS